MPIARHPLLSAILCTSMLLGACSDGQSGSTSTANSSAPQAASQVPEDSNLFVVTITAKEWGSEDQPACLFEFSAENRGKEKLSPMLTFEPWHAQKNELMTEVVSAFKEIIFNSVKPGETRSGLTPMMVSGTHCPDIKLKPTKDYCMGDCTYQWKAEGFAGML